MATELIAKQLETEYVDHRFPTHELTPQITYEYELPDLSGVQDGFRMEAFNLNHEMLNIHQGVITDREAVETQLEFFLEEYLTTKRESVFRYTFGEDQNLHSKDWSKPMLEIYRDSAYDPNIDERTRLVRNAELTSFEKIQEIIRSQIGKPEEQRQAAILISPAENYDSPYAFVSAYEVEEKDGKYSVKVTNRKVFMNLSQLHQAKKDWIAERSAFHSINESHLLDISGVESLDLLSNPLITYNPDMAHMLLDSLPSYSPEETGKINEQLESFMPEIRYFVDHMYQSDLSGADMAKLTNLFKIFLIKAKVHFDEDWARGEWGDIVDEIKTITMQPYVLNSIIADTKKIRALRDGIFDLEIMIAGSCGKVGTSSITGIVKALTPETGLDHLFDESATTYICTFCRHSHDITPAGGGLRTKCDCCGTPIPRCESNN